MTFYKVAECFEIKYHIPVPLTFVRQVFGIGMEKKAISYNRGKQVWTRPHKSLIIVALVMLLVFGMARTVSAAETGWNGKTVRVGYVDYYGFIENEMEETFTSYCVDYLNEIYEYTGWNIEYVSLFFSEYPV